MEDHNSTHINRMVTSGQWKHFFKDLDQSHRGKQMRLLKGEDLMEGSASSMIQKLRSVEYKGSGNHHNIVVISDLDGDLQENIVEFNLV